MKPRIGDYYPAIGMMTVAFSRLEEVILWSVLNVIDVSIRSEGRSTREEHARRLRTSVSKNIEELRSGSSNLRDEHKKELFGCLDRAKLLIEQRNKNIHGVWFEWIEHPSGDFHEVQRWRYDRSGDDIRMDIETPAIDDLKALAREANEVANELENFFQRTEIRAKFLKEWSWLADD